MEETIHAWIVSGMGESWSLNQETTCSDQRLESSQQGDAVAQMAVLSWEEGGAYRIYEPVEPVATGRDEMLEVLKITFWRCSELGTGLGPSDSHSG